MSVNNRLSFIDGIHALCAGVSREESQRERRSGEVPYNIADALHKVCGREFGYFFDELDIKLFIFLVLRK